MEHFEVQRPIGSGSYGSCLLVRRRRDGLAAVIKEIRVEGMPAAEREEVLSEARIMAALKHPNIVQLIDDWSVLSLSRSPFPLSLRHAASLSRSPWPGLAGVDRGQWLVN